MSRPVFQFGVRRVPVWPDQQTFYPLDEPSVKVANFDDTEIYHSALKRRILELRRSDQFRDYLFPGGCGTKVRSVDQWGSIEADLVHARAIALFKLAYGQATAVVDSSWASIYDKGDHCVPHSHLRSIASVVYMLDLGDQDIADTTGGRFSFADPRVPVCCQVEAGRMTHHLIPTLKEGSMMIFPAELVHMVTPYSGTRPRITMSWNLHTHILPGRPEDAFRS
jgi:hypothetical protein